MSTVRERSMAQVDKAKGAALTGYANAKDAAQGTYASTQDTLQTGLDKTQHTLVNGWEKVQDWLHTLNQGNDITNELPVLTKNRGGILPHLTQDNIQTASAQAQKKVQKSLNKAQDAANKQAAQASAGLAKAQQKLGKAWGGVQDTLGGVQDTLQDNVQTSTAKFSKTLDKGTKKATKNLTKATTNIKGMRDNAQDRYEHHLRKQQRARSMFRWGLVIGVVLALLYTPKPGVEMRAQLATWWQHYRTRLGL